MPGPKRRWTNEQLAEAISVSTSWSQVASHIGLAGATGSSFTTMKRVAADLGLVTGHFKAIAWNKGTGAGRDRQAQRDAKQRWYDSNRHVYRERNKRKLLEHRERIRRIKSVPCADCGLRFPPVVMDFDHRDGETKSGTVSTKIGIWGWARILAEIAKCDIICANCHRIRTARRAGWPGAELVIDMADLSESA